MNPERDRRRDPSFYYLIVCLIAIVFKPLDSRKDKSIDLKTSKYKYIICRPTVLVRGYRGAIVGVRYSVIFLMISLRSGNSEQRMVLLWRVYGRLSEKDKIKGRILVGIL